MSRDEGPDTVRYLATMRALAPSAVREWADQEGGDPLPMSTEQDGTPSPGCRWYTRMSESPWTTQAYLIPGRGGRWYVRHAESSWTPPPDYTSERSRFILFIQPAKNLA